MTVLGLLGFGMNPGACLLRDGRLVAFAEEERFTRFKGSHGFFPGKSIEYCLAEAKLRLGDVDRIAFAWDSNKYPYLMLRQLARQYVKYRGAAARAYRKGEGGDGGNVFTAAANVMKYTPGMLREEIRLGLRAAGLMDDVPPVEFVSHHLCHAYSTYFCSPFTEAIVLTLDGSGEDNCTQIAIGRGDTLEVKENVLIPHSLGWFYAAFTAYLGFIPYRDEGKLMGLAALGEERRAQNPWPERLSRILKVERGSYEVDPIYTKFGGHWYAERFTDALVKFVTDFDPNLVPIGYGEKIALNGGPPVSKYLDPRYVDLAWGVQEKLEQAAKALVERAVRDYGIRNLCVAGGVGLNCKMNGELLQATPVERIFVQPAANDAGTAIGAAMIVAQAGGDRIWNRLDHVYYGPGYSNAEIRKALDGCKVPYEEPADVVQRIADDLAAGKIVAWFQGRMEFGSRALGGRSIIANPVFPGMKDKVNNQVKYRESWRPFCPSLIDEAKGDYLEHAAEAPFMIVAFPVKPDKRELIPSAVHVDGTVRPQTVTREANPRFHALISEVGRRTGHPVILNTSFNVRGEPIICTPLDAVRCFYSTGLDTLAIGDFVLSKPSGA
jgi:carbamoyltransferase